MSRAVNLAGFSSVIVPSDNIVTSGVITAAQFVGDGSELTNVTGSLAGDDIDIKDLNVTGIATFGDPVGINSNLTVDGKVSVAGTVKTGNLYVDGNVSIAGTLSYEDVANVDVIGLVTARGGVEVGNPEGVSGIGITLNNAGGGSFTGIITASSFEGDGSTLSGVVTSLVAGDNISLDASQGRVTITGLADTSRINADDLNVNGISTVGVLSATSIDATGIITATEFKGSFTGVSTGSDRVKVDGTNNDTDFKVLFSTENTPGFTRPQIDQSNDFHYNPSENALKVGVVTGATYFGDGSNLAGVADTSNVRTNSLQVVGVTTLDVTSAKTLNVTGVTTLGVITSVTSIEATNFYGSAAGLTGIPPGAQGIQGFQGLQGTTGIGAQGEDGTQGFQGIQGTTGEGTQGTDGTQGIQGFQGRQGTQGITGDPGTQGEDGTQGFQGITGNIGLQGLQGHQGRQGITGNQGTDGTQGTDGEQGIQGRQGTAGSPSTAPGPQGLQGFQGRQGRQGILGNQGADGTGNQGIQGRQGRQGTTGPGGTGPQGIQGIQGRQGTTGSPGSGSPGPPGPTGALGFRSLGPSPSQNSTPSPSSTLVASDAGKVVNINANWRIIVPPNVFSAGDAITIINTDPNTANGSYRRNIEEGSGVTLIYSATTEEGDMWLIQNGMCTILCIGSNTFLVSGSGLSS